MLSSEDLQKFLEDSATVNTVESFLRFLGVSEIVQQLETKIASGALTDEAMRSFVKGLLVQFIPGRAFYGDKLLALLAYLVRLRPGAFATDFLSELVDLSCQEIPLAPRLAQLLLRKRKTMATMTARETHVWHPLWREEDNSVHWRVDGKPKEDVLYPRLTYIEFKVSSETHVSNKKLRAA